MFDRLIHKWLGYPYRLHFTVHGDKTKPTIVLLHGLAVDSNNWSDFIPILKENYRIITIDLLGSGKSPKPQWCNYTMKDHLKALKLTLLTIDLPHRYILAGHSLGSLLATRLALSEKRHIKRLLLLSPPVYPPLDSLSSKKAIRLTGLLLSFYKLVSADKISPELFKKISFIFPFPRNILKDRAMWTPTLRTLKNCIEEQTIIKDATRIRAQTDVFFGKFDQVLVKSNVRLLGSNKQITLHEFIGDHLLSRSYAKVVARVLQKTS